MNRISLGDITSARLICFKGLLFVLLGALAAGLLIFEHRSFKTALLIGLAVWSFARAYYFAFYVIEHYVDPSYRFAGLVSALRYLWRTKGKGVGTVEGSDGPGV